MWTDGRRTKTSHKNSIEQTEDMSIFQNLNAKCDGKTDRRTDRRTCLQTNVNGRTDGRTYDGQRPLTKAHLRNQFPLVHLPMARDNQYHGCIRHTIAAIIPMISYE
ncbi:hypothetical protein DPMN_000107 [Dreissena polymorpha]|uniref:Uncharacterized protein n=1 Tax=Dreissena polymorpha TaxID=45954 RepID=A0A9D4RPM7_DREPO|nr:hypothetical protein DPMN_000107 [Dreissena polymorpha]